MRTGRVVSLSVGVGFTVVFALALVAAVNKPARGAKAELVTPAEQTVNRKMKADRDVILNRSSAVRRPPPVLVPAPPPAPVAPVLRSIPRSQMRVASG